jgi:hypothetical protein
LLHNREGNDARLEKPVFPCESFVKHYLKRICMRWASNNSICIPSWWNAATDHRFKYINISCKVSKLWTDRYIFYSICYFPHRQICDTHQFLIKFAHTVSSVWFNLHFINCRNRIGIDVHVQLHNEPSNCMNIVIDQYYQLPSTQLYSILFSTQSSS